MMTDSKLKQAEADEILASLSRAGMPWDPKVAIIFTGDTEGMTPDEKRAATSRAIDLYEKYGEGLRQAGEHEIADNYFKHPRQLDALRNYLPK